MSMFRVDTCVCAFLVAQMVRIRLPCGRPEFTPWVGKIPWRKKWQPTPVLLPGIFDGWRSLVHYSPWDRKEPDTTEQLHWHWWQQGVHDLSHSQLLVLFLKTVRASPSSAAKNIMNLIWVLIIWWCPCVGFSLALLEKGVCYDQCVLLANLCYPLPFFILYSMAKLACYSRYVLTSYICIPLPFDENDIFWGC